MKKFFLMIIVFLLIWCCRAYAEPIERVDEEEILREQTELYGTEISEEMENFEGTGIHEVVPGFDAEELLSGLVEGKEVFSVNSVIDKGLDILFGEMKNTVRLLVMIVAIAVFCTYLTNIQSSFQTNEMSGVAFFVCYLVISGITAAALLEVVDCGRVLVNNISVFMRMMVPVMLVSLASSGAPVSATTFELVMVGVIEITEWIIEVFFIPMIMMSAALNLVNNLSNSLNADKLVQFMNKTIKWGIGIVMTVFVGVMSLQSIVSGGADALTVKVTKFATSNLIPVVGGSLAETVETVIKCGVVIKNSVGVLGIIVVVLMAAVPLLKIAACLIMFRLCAAVVQPISDEKIVKCVSGVSDAIASVLGLVTAVTVMFVIILTIIIKVAS